MDEPAFPIGYINEHGNEIYQGGMTLRDYFAGRAMQGILANDEMAGLRLVQIPERAYLMADAMLAERESEDKK